MDLFVQTVNNIGKIDKVSLENAWIHLDSLSKPIRSLGVMEEIVTRMAGITGRLHNEFRKKSIVIFCSDNGICDEGVSGCSQNVTNIVTHNIPDYKTGVGVISKFYNCDLTVVDVGVIGEIKNNKVINRKISEGTKNMRYGPSMTREQCIKSIEVGIEIVDELCNNGYDIFGTGEMGIGNTSTSSAVISVLLNIPLDNCVGLGAGLNEGQLQHKINVLRDSISFNNPKKNDVIDVISKVGGYDIGGLCGAFLSAAKNRKPIVIDGIISCAAALCAYKINPLTRDYMFTSHKSAERAVNEVFKYLDLKPILDLDMRLGEGSGCPIGISVIESSLFMSREMDSFKEAGMSESEQNKYEILYEERKEYEK
ncbi:MAG: nicotinate-nucleotide--dimethylbenzimidazole phosphoribosyltransferase [Clostridium sp.]